MSRGAEEQGERGRQGEWEKRKEDWKKKDVGWFGNPSTLRQAQGKAHHKLRKRNDER